MEVEEAESENKMIKADGFFVSRGAMQTDEQLGEIARRREERESLWQPPPKKSRAPAAGADGAAGAAGAKQPSRRFKSGSTRWMVLCRLSACLGERVADEWAPPPPPPELKPGGERFEQLLERVVALAKTHSVSIRSCARPSPPPWASRRRRSRPSPPRARPPSPCWCGRGACCASWRGPCRSCRRRRRARRRPRTLRWRTGSPPRRARSNSSSSSRRSGGSSAASCGRGASSSDRVLPCGGGCGAEHTTRRT